MTRTAGSGTTTEMRSFGWEPDRRTVRPEEADALREVITAVIKDGQSISESARRLNEAGHLTPTGKQWDAANLGRVFRRPNLAGLYQRQDGKLGKTGAEQIITPAEYRRLQAALQAAAAAGHGVRRPGTAERYLLAGGLVECGLCGHTLEANRSNNGRRSYVCPRRRTPRTDKAGCGKIRVAAEPLEEHVAAQVLARLALPESAAVITAALQRDAAAADRMKKDLAAAEDRLRDLTGQFGRGELFREAFIPARDTIQAEITDLRRRLDRVRTFAAAPELDPEHLADWWTKAGLDQQRALITMLVSRIRVNPVQLRGGKRFETERVVIDWRGVSA